MYSYRGRSNSTQQLAATHNQQGEQGAYYFIHLFSSLIVHVCGVIGGQKKYELPQKTENKTDGLTLMYIYIHNEYICIYIFILYILLLFLYIIIL